MITIETGFISIKQDWERLYSPERDTIFQSYSYNWLYWEHHNRCGELAIIVYRDNEGLVRAILPTFIRNRELRFINDSGTDFCDIIYDREIHLLDVLDEMMGFLSSMREKVNIIALNNLRVSSPLLPYFKVLSQESYVYSSNEYSFIFCNKSEQPINSLEHLSQNKKRKLLKILSKTSDCRFEIYNSKTKRDFPENELRYLANFMVEQGWRNVNKYRDDFWNYIRDIYNCGQIEVALLCSSDNQPLSAGLVFVNEFKSIRWIIFYTDKKYNLWNNVHYINEKTKLFSYENNFGRGGYDYKINNFRPELGILFFLLVPLNMRGRIYAYKDIIRYFTKRCFRGTGFYRFISHIRIRLHNFLVR